MDQSDVLAGLPVAPVATMDDAIVRMSAIAGQLPQSDGLACFNRMYLIVTEAVRSRVTQGFFADPEFMALLDVNFANRYFAAIQGFCAQPSTAPRAWSVLLARRSETNLAPIQFALAGLNAHINLDLAVAVVTTCEHLKTAPDDGAHHGDYQKVNQTLSALDRQIRESFEQGVLLELDHEFAGLEDLVGNFSINAARDTAWVNAEVAWRIRGESFLYKTYVDTIDRSVAFAGRTLLTPLPAR